MGYRGFLHLKIRFLTGFWQVRIYFSLSLRSFPWCYPKALKLISLIFVFSPVLLVLFSYPLYATLKTDLSGEQVKANDFLSQGHPTREKTEISQTTPVVKKIGEELIRTGVVVDHNQEDINIGNYLLVELDVNHSVVYVLYNPYYDGSQSNCPNRVDTDVVVGDRVEIRGFEVVEYNSVKAVGVISTCESSDGYIKKI